MEPIVQWAKKESESVMKTTVQLAVAIVTLIGAAWGVAAWAGVDFPVRMSQHVGDLKRLENSFSRWVMVVVRQNKANAIRAINVELAVLRNRQIALDIEIASLTERARTADLADRARIISLREERERIMRQTTEAEKERQEILISLQIETTPDQMTAVPPRMIEPPR